MLCTPARLRFDAYGVAAAGGDGAEFEVSAVVKAVLASTQNEVTLPGALQGHALTFALSFADGKDEGEVIASLPEEPEEWMVTFAEAWTLFSLSSSGATDTSYTLSYVPILWSVWT